MKPVRVCVVESLASQRRQDALPTQGAILADLLESDGYSVLRTSYAAQPLVRAADMAQFLIRHRHAYDVIVLQMFGHRAFNYARLVSALAGVLHKRLIVVLADSDLARLWLMRRPAMDAVLQRADVVVAPSRWLEEMLKPRYSVVVIPNVIDVARYVFVEKRRIRRRLLWARAYHPQYDPLLAIEIAHELRQRHDDVFLTMVGPDHGLREACETRVRHCRLSTVVVLRGTLAKCDLVRVSAQHDVHLHTNVVDNMPVTLLEQMALGLPIVASAVDGIPYFASDRETALLVWERTPAAYADAIDALVSNSGLSSRLSRNGRAFVEANCSWAANRQRWREVLTA